VPLEAEVPPPVALAGVPLGLTPPDAGPLAALDALPEDALLGAEALDDPPAAAVELVVGVVVGDDVALLAETLAAAPPGTVSAGGGAVLAVVEAPPPQPPSAAARTTQAPSAARRRFVTSTREAPSIFSEPAAPSVCRNASSR
jgi:hypothetical protein